VQQELVYLACLSSQDMVVGDIVEVRRGCSRSQSIRPSLCI
jgi:hypothetical protein